MNKEDIFAATLQGIGDRISSALNEAIAAAGPKVLFQNPDLPIRGRYVSLRLLVDGPAEATNGAPGLSARLSIQDGRLVAIPAETHTGLFIMRFGDRPWTLAEPVAFFIPEHVQTRPAAPSVRTFGWR